MTQPDQQPQIDPQMVLAKIEQRGELGAALVREAHFHVLAEHYAAELGRLKQGDDQGGNSDGGDEGKGDTGVGADKTST